jgi:hypothetical protein
MKVLRLNEKSNKSKEKEESGMEIVLNAFEKGDRKRKQR